MSQAHNAGFKFGQGRGGGEHTWDAFLNDVKTKVLPEAAGVYNLVKKRIVDSQIPPSQRGKGRGRVKRGGMFAAKPYAKPPDFHKGEKEVVDTMVDYINRSSRTYRNQIRGLDKEDQQFYMRQCLKDMASAGLVPEKYKSHDEVKYLIPRAYQYILTNIRY
jgi:hypothetical protein